MSFFSNPIRDNLLIFVRMEQFKIISPSAGLAPYVRHYWLLVSDDVAHAQRVIPTGCVELVFHRGHLLMHGKRAIPRTSVSGQTRTFADLLLTGTVDMIVVVFRPFGARAFFDMPVCELAGLTVPADDLNMRALKELEEQILYTEDDRRCICLIESFLLSRLNPVKVYNYDRMAAAVGIINFYGGEIPVSSLAEKVCLSNKQFLRIFNEYVGTSPKEFMRLVRFHKALYTLQNHSAMSFTVLAHECGYYDQAHLIRDFKLFSGYTPGEYRAMCAPFSDYFSY